jgi:hypothetical protein
MTNSNTHGNPQASARSEGAPAAGGRRFARFKTLMEKLRRPARICGKALAAVALTSVVAIGGANLGTYFDYVFNNFEYGKLRNKTTLTIKSGHAEDTPELRSALEAAVVKVVGAVPPEKADLYLRLDKDGEGNTTLSTRYVMVWSTNKGVKHRDEEEVRISWKYSESGERFVPLMGLTRYHNKWVEMPLAGLKDKPVIVIQNPAHTPGIPGTSLRYIEGQPGPVDVFTDFAARKRAGSCLSLNKPQRFDSKDVNFDTHIETAETR